MEQLAVLSMNDKPFVFTVVCKPVQLNSPVQRISMKENSWFRTRARSTHGPTKNSILTKNKIESLEVKINYSSIELLI